MCFAPSPRNPGCSPFAEPAAAPCIVGDAGDDQKNERVDDMFVHDFCFSARAYLIFNARMRDASTNVTRLARMMGSA